MSPQVEVTFEGYANKKHCVCECGHQLNYCISVIEELKGFDGGLDKHIHSLKHRDKLNPHTAPVSAAPANTQAITSFFKPRSKSNTPSNTNTTAPQATSANKNSNRRKKTSNTLPSVENVGASKKQNTIKHKLVFIESGPHPSIVEIQDGDPARIEYCAGFIPQFIQKMLDKGVCAANDIPKYIPWDIIGEQVDVWGGALHHKNCTKIVIEPSERCRGVNAICASLGQRKSINKAIATGCTYPARREPTNIESESKRDGTQDTRLSEVGKYKKILNQKSKLTTLRSKVQGRDRKLHNNMVKISFYQRIATAVASADSSGAARIVKSYIDGGKSQQWVLQKLDLYINGLYSPKGYLDDNFFRAAIVWIMGGGKLANILFKSGILMCTKTTKARLKQWQSQNVINDEITKDKVLARYKEIHGSMGNPDNAFIHVKADEIYISSKLEVDTKTHRVVGLCCEHNDTLRRIQHIHTEQDADIVIDYVKDKDTECHLSTMVNVVQVHVVTEHKTCVFLVAALGHCGLKAHAYHKKWIQIMSIVTIPQFILLSLTSDGCSQWRRAKRALLGESQSAIDTGLAMVPTKVVGQCAYTSDQRHNIKGVLAAASRGNGVKVLNITVNVKIIFAHIKKFKIDQREKMPLPRVKSICLGYKNDPMNVPNASKYHGLCDSLSVVLASNLEDANYTALQRPHELKTMRAIIIYSRVHYPYVCTLFNRTCGWNTILQNLATSAFGCFVLFNANGSRSMSWENYFEKQITSKGMFQIMTRLVDLAQHNKDIARIPIHLFAIQSQSLEDLFSVVRAMHSGKIMTTSECLRLLGNADILEMILCERESWRVENPRLDGVERINATTVLANRTLMGGDEDGKEQVTRKTILHAYQCGQARVKQIFSTWAPEYYEQNKDLFRFDNPNINWLRTPSKNYEYCEDSESSEDDDSDCDGPSDSERERAIEHELQEASVIRQEIGLSAMKFRLESEDHLDAGEILNESTSCMINTKKYSWIHIQQYLNYELNMAQYKGDKSQRVSHDRNRGVKRVKATGNVGDFNNNLEDTLSGALVVGDFVLLQGTRHKFMMCKTMKIYSIAEDGSVEQLMNCGFKDMNSDALYTDLLCLPYQHSRSRSMFTIIADDTHAEAHNDRLRCKIPIKQIIRLYYSLKDHVFQVGEKEIVNCIASLSQSNESDKEKEKALKAIKVDESLYVKLKKTAHHVSQKKQNQTQVKDKTTKAKATVPAKKKSIKETYNLPFECVNKHKKASGIFCVFCGTTVALSDMIRHQSLHFVKEDDNDDDTTDETTTTTPTFTFAVPQPTLQYYIDDGCLKVRSLAEPIELRGDECGICYSKCCRRIVVRTSKASRSKAETLKAFSECPLNFNYNYRSASVSSISNPVVNVPVNCPQENCDFMPYKYLLNEHMKRCHQTTANMSLTTEQLQQHNDRLKADMKREFKGEVLCDKPPSSNKNTNDKGKRATKERAAAKYSCE
eukprot:104753_1